MFELIAKFHDHITKQRKNPYFRPEAKTKHNQKEGESTLSHVKIVLLSVFSVADHLEDVIK